MTEPKESEDNSKEERIERINKAISWYRKHYIEIKPSMPIETTGSRFNSSGLASLEKFIDLWENYSSLSLTESYVYYPLVRIRDFLKKCPSLN